MATQRSVSETIALALNLILCGGAAIAVVINDVLSGLGFTLYSLIPVWISSAALFAVFGLIGNRWAACLSMSVALSAYGTLIYAILLVGLEDMGDDGLIEIFLFVLPILILSIVNLWALWRLFKPKVEALS